MKTHCAFCGNKNYKRKMSIYCSKECGAAAQELKIRERNNIYEENKLKIKPCSIKNFTNQN